MILAHDGLNVPSGYQQASDDDRCDKHVDGHGEAEVWQAVQDGTFGPETPKRLRGGDGLEACQDYGYESQLRDF